MDKKIALYMSSLRKGGAERVIANLAGYFSRKGWQVLLITTRQAEIEYEISREVVRQISEPAREELTEGRIFNFILRFRKLRGIWKAENPDIIVSFIGKNNMMALLTAFGFRIPIVVSVRGEPAQEYYNGYMRFIARWLFRLAEGIILQTKRSRSFFPKAVQKKTVILKNPIHSSFFRDRYEGERENTIVAIGKVDGNKNHEMLIQAFASLGDEYSQFRLIIYGEGEKRLELLQLVEEDGLNGRVFLPGSVENVSEIIYRARVFVLPSNTEGMPNTLIEAMLMGLTVISTDCPCGGPAELIEHGVNGLLTPVGDVEGMKACLELVLGNPELADEMGRNAAKISEDYRAEAVYGSWERYLEGLIRK